MKMSFEKNEGYVETVSRSNCSGCSNGGSNLYSAKFTSQSSSNAGRCSNC